MIELVSLDKSYGTRRILAGAALTVRAGESVALVGANGSGKTTTLRCAVGLARPDRGRIVIDGIDLIARPENARARVSYLAQRTEFPATLTVREILAVVADLRGAGRQSVEREIALCGLTSVADRTSARLSGGEQQRVAMAALFIPDVTAYLLDEPTLNLDPVGTRLLIDRLGGMRDEGRSVLFTTHVVGDLDDLATRVAVLHEGRILTELDDVHDGERHFSMSAEHLPERFVGAALAAGATRAWVVRGRLHVMVDDSLLSAMLARLESEGARIGALRTESALAAALERLNDEERPDEIEAVDRVDRRAAVGELWRQGRRAPAGSFGPR